MKKTEEAECSLNSKYTIGYDDIRANSNMGIAKLKLGNNKGAISFFEKVVQLDPQSKTAYNNIGTAKARSGDIKGSLYFFDKQIEFLT